MKPTTIEKIQALIDKYEARNRETTGDYNKMMAVKESIQKEVVNYGNDENWIYAANKCAMLEERFSIMFTVIVDLEKLKIK